jgi:hypothetical protein
MENKEITYVNTGPSPTWANAYVILEKVNGSTAHTYHGYYNDRTNLFKLYPSRCGYSGKVKFEHKTVSGNKVIRGY